MGVAPVRPNKIAHPLRLLPAPCAVQCMARVLLTNECSAVRRRKEKSGAAASTKIHNTSHKPQDVAENQICHVLDPVRSYSREEGAPQGVRAI